MVSELIILNSGNIILQVRERLERGQSVNGGIIGTYRWESYRLFKQSLNPLAGGTVDLILTGALTDALTVRRTGTSEYQIFSTDAKYQNIGKKYGFEEFGLTPLQLDELWNELFELAMQTILADLWE